VNAANSFLRTAMMYNRVPVKITLVTYAASHRAVREMKEDGEPPRRVKVAIQPVLEQAARSAGHRACPCTGSSVQRSKESRQ
jgi:hypothetical protein